MNFSDLNNCPFLDHMYFECEVSLNSSWLGSILIGVIIEDSLGTFAYAPNTKFETLILEHNVNPLGFSHQLVIDHLAPYQIRDM